MGAGPDRPAGTPPRPPSRSRHRGPVRPEPAPAEQPYKYNGSPLAAFLYWCAALGAAVLIWLCKNPPPPSYEYEPLQGYRGLAAAVVAAIVVTLIHRDPPRQVDQEIPDTPRQVLVAPAPQLKQPRLSFTGSVLDAERVAAAIRSSMADITTPFLAVSPPRADSSESDAGGASSSDGDEVVNFWYTSIHLLDAGGARLIVPDFTQQLGEMVQGLHQADAVELLRRAFRDAEKTGVFSYRLFDVVLNQCAASADPHLLADRSTGNLVMTTKITAKLLRLIWFELDGQNWLFQEVKKECFREIVGQSVEKLLDVALSLSNARWSADHFLTTFDALVDALYNILGLPLRRYEPVHNVVAHMFCNIVVDFRGMLEATIAESTIQPATVTVLLVRFLEFFYRNGQMMQSVLGTGDCTIELTMINSWVSKLGRDAEIMFPAKMLQVKGQRDIFVLNNMFYVYQMKDHPGGFLSSMELQSLCLLIDQYMKSYLQECWVPIVRYLDGDSLKMPRRSSLHNFLEEFFSICDVQMTWEVPVELKEILREKIVDLIVPKYENFLRVLQEENPSSWCPCWAKGMWRARREKPMYTAAWLKRVVRGFFEG